MTSRYPFPGESGGSSSMRPSRGEHFRRNGGNRDEQIAWEIAQARPADPAALEHEHPLVRAQYDYLSRTNYSNWPPASSHGATSQEPPPSHQPPKAVPTTENWAVEQGPGRDQALEGLFGDLRVNNTPERREGDKILRVDKNKRTPLLPDGSSGGGLRGLPTPESEYPFQTTSSFSGRGSSERSAPQYGNGGPSRLRSDSLVSKPAAALPTPPPEPPGTSQNNSGFMSTDALNSNAPDEPLECEVCQEAKPNCVICNICRVVFCETCWPEYIPHRPGRKNPVKGVKAPKHEPIDPIIEAKLDRILEPQIQEQEQEALLDRDEDTAWFAVVRDDADDLIFQDLGRYGNIVAGLHKKAYPALVSFVGPTGSGKSTLIKMLMELDYSGVQPYETPVVKSAACFGTIPTSGDVHLFCDPHTCKPDYDRPILYADCEGLEGGERTPLGSRTLKREKLQKRISEHLPGKDSKSFSRRNRAKHQSSERELKWATTDGTKRREFVVSELYPRILYTFSDVVVFVLRETNKLESVIERLLIWATAALEKSSNQPVLPCAIIAMNSLPTEASDSFWNVATSTRDVLTEVNIEFSRNPKFKPFIRRWEDRGTKVESVWGLLNLYYDNICVVRIPRKGRSTLIREQVAQLYKEIEHSVRHSQRMKRERRMLMSAATLQTQLQSAYDHFADTLTGSFDFVKSTFLHNPIPSDFGGNILKLILGVKKHTGTNLPQAGQLIFKTVAPMIASCIMLDAARQRIAGTAAELFPEYSPSCDDAFQDFLDKHWECEYRHPSDPNIRCVNSRVGHNTKGHQDHNSKIISTGEYISSLTQGYAEIFRELVMAYLVTIENKLKQYSDRNPEEEERTRVSKLHRDEYMVPFYTGLGRAQGSNYFVSHSTCLVCLVHSPEHHLRCGHVICTPCLQTYGHQQPGCIAIGYCPMHPEDQTFHPPQLLMLKPPSAGVRVLSLDGGGVRGLSQLIILDYLERALGCDLQLTSFFDLIVGTSTGAQIALGLVAKQWSISECIRQFKEICRESFTVRRWVSWSGIPQFGTSIKYKTLPAQQALIKAFSSNEYLFGGIKISSRPVITPKVAVTTASSSGKAIVLGNYNRVNQAGSESYDFPRSELPEHEIKIWEAARASSATPGYFKEFPHMASKEVYLDGSVYHYNPIYIADSERKLIWPDVEHLPPDIVLSIGSGFNPHPKSRKPKKFRTKGVAQAMELLHWVSTDRIESSLAAEETWKSWLRYINTNQPLDSQAPENRYVRWNVRFDEHDDPPHLDDLNSLQRIEWEAQRQFQSFGKQIKSLADHLICSTFYFEMNNMYRVSDITGHTREVRCRGNIKCRFSPHTNDIKKLGLFFMTLNDQRDLGRSWKPYFTVRERSPEPRFGGPIYIDERITAQMNRMKFELPEIEFTASSEEAVIEVSLCLDEKSVFPISGFPAQILLMNSQNGIAPRNLSLRRGARVSTSSSSETSAKSPTSSLTNVNETKRPEQLRPVASNYAGLAAFFSRPKSGAQYQKLPENVFELPADVPSIVVEADSGTRSA